MHFYPHFTAEAKELGLPPRSLHWDHIQTCGAGREPQAPEASARGWQMCQGPLGAALLPPGVAPGGHTNTQGQLQQLCTSALGVS